MTVKNGEAEIVFTQSELTVLILYFYAFCGDGVLAHPSTVAYKEIEATLEEAVEDQGILSEETVIDKIIDAVVESVYEILERVRLVIEAFISMFITVCEHIVDDLKI